MILAMGIFYGGIAQVIAGLIDFRKGNEFGATAFTSYGLFWLSLVALVVFPDHGLGEEPTSRAMGWYLFSWASSRRSCSSARSARRARSSSSS